MVVSIPQKNPPACDKADQYRRSRCEQPTDLAVGDGLDDGQVYRGPVRDVQGWHLELKRRESGSDGR